MGVREMKEVIFFVLSIPVFLVLYLFTAVMVTYVVLLSYLGFDRNVNPVIRFWARTVFLLTGRKVHLTGMENCQPGGQYLLVTNHASLFDILAIMAFFPQVVWFGKSYLTRIPVFGRLLKIIHYVPRTQPGYRNTKEMLRRMIDHSGGRIIALFPEGTRTTTGHLNEFQRGFIHILRMSGSDLLPVTLNGFYRFKPKTRFSIGLGTKLGMVIHPPVPNALLMEKNDREIIAETKHIIESAYQIK
ncbi:MAG TPA: lysophospholipid acyltransferase family protein [Prolixibacteraceae bacterium]|nr:lysophospholipid acyltransferase family protein [Prolixibacteraceae bacterium]